MIKEQLENILKYGSDESASVGFIPENEKQSDSACWSLRKDVCYQLPSFLAFPNLLTYHIHHSRDSHSQYPPCLVYIHLHFCHQEDHQWGVDKECLLCVKTKGVWWMVVGEWQWRSLCTIQFYSLLRFDWLSNDGEKAIGLHRRALWV